MKNLLNFWNWIPQFVWKLFVILTHKRTILYQSHEKWDVIFLNKFRVLFGTYMYNNTNTCTYIIQRLIIIRRDRNCFVIAVFSITIAAPECKRHTRNIIKNNKFVSTVLFACLHYRIERIKRRRCEGRYIN